MQIDRVWKWSKGQFRSRKLQLKFWFSTWRKFVNDFLVLLKILLQKLIIRVWTDSRSPTGVFLNFLTRANVCGNEWFWNTFQVIFSYSSLKTTLYLCTSFTPGLTGSHRILEANRCTLEILRGNTKLKLFLFNNNTRDKVL